jgi:hypothetical protein
MKNITVSLLCLGILLAPVGLARAEPPLTRGKVLVLQNEHTLGGDIERVGDQYRVRRLTGETWVPADRVLRLCASLEDALALLQSRANLRDPDERLRLATWCRQNGLHEKALEEAEAALHLRPEHAETRRLVSNLRAAALARTAAPAVPARKKPEPPETIVDVTADSVSLFTTRVQPILMNTCASCHASERGGAFRLSRIYDYGLGNRRTVEQNLAAVLAQVNLREPQLSTLLNKAVSIHAPGMLQAPLRNRQVPAYRTLEEWVRLTLANNPQLLAGTQTSTRSVSEDSTTRSVSEDANTNPKRQRGDFGRQQPAASSPPAPTPGTVPPRAAATPPRSTAPAPHKPEAPASRQPVSAGSADPVDPEVFNRQFHPAVRPKDPSR